MNDTITLPNVGDKVRAKHIPSVTGREDREWTNDYVFTVTDIKPDHTWFDDGHQQGPAVWGDFTSPDNTFTYSYYVTKWEPVETLADIVEPPLSEQEQRIKDLEAQNEELKATIRRIESEAVAAITSIGETLIDESNERGWCETFDDLIDIKNETLPGWLQLPIRQREYRVSWTEYVSVAIQRSTGVIARNYNEAIEIAQNDDCGFDLNDLSQAYYNGDCETTDTSDWEAEED